ncbi:MAG: tRNA (adenosine(37)-N6)-dimethylallyltransferase MiaA [Pseudoflavonifractor sp.]
MPPKILVICGPTASGKTGLAVALALRHGGEVISADSMQIYRGMDIGTAKPTPAEMQGVPHHMLDVADPGEDYSVARYVETASACVDDVLARGKLPILAGGTGLYIDSLLSGRTFAAFTPAAGHRARLQARAAAEGIAPLLAELEKVDPDSAARLHPADEKRIIRALEVWHETGKTITAHNAETLSIPPRYEALTIGLDFADRADLWSRIDLRVNAMMAAGLEGEVRRLLGEGLPPGSTAMQAIGYKELAAAIAEARPIPQAAEEIKLRSRQYAKRQRSWFRRNQATKWIFWDRDPNFSAALQNSTAYMEEFGLL